MIEQSWIWEILACPECGQAIPAQPDSGGEICCTTPGCGYRSKYLGRRFDLLPAHLDAHELAENEFRLRLSNSFRDKFPEMSPETFLRLNLFNRISYYNFSATYLFMRDEFVPRYKLQGRGLEIGGAAGHSSGFIRFFYPNTQVITSDVAPFNVEFAQELANFVGFETDYFVAGNAENLPFLPASFDFLFSSGMLHHLGDLNRALAQGLGVLKPGGRWYIINELSIGGLPRLYWNSRFGLKGQQAIQTGVRENSYTLAEWEQFFTKAGFRILERRFLRNPRYKMESWPRAAYYDILGRLPESIIRMGLPCEVNFVLEKAA